MAEIDIQRKEPLIETTGFRLSWGAILAGLVVATMIQIVLALLGLAIGFAAWDPGDPLRDLGIGAGIWYLVSALIALFFGGATAGRLAGILTRADGAMHGVVVWGLAWLLGFWLLVSGLGFILGGAFGLLGRTTAAVAGGVVGGVTDIGAAVVGQMGDVEVDQLQAEIEAALRETRDPALRPDTLAQAAEDVRQRAAADASNRELAAEIRERIRRRAGQVDREDIVNVIVARTGMSRAEAERLTERVESLAASTQRGIATTVDTLGARAESAVAAGTESLSRIAWWMLLGMVLSLVAAVIGASATARE